MASRSISKSVIWQLGGKFALQGIAFFTTPIFTRLLAPSDYGYTALYASWLAILSLIEGLQVAGSIGNARLEYGEEKLPEYLSCIMSVSALSFFIILAISIIFHNYLASIMGISPEMVILVAVQSFCAFVINFEVGRLDQLKKVEKSTLLSLCQTILIVILSLIFVVTTKGSKANAKIYGQAIPVILFGIVIFVLVYIRGKLIWNREYIKFCLALTLPLIVHGVGHLIFSQSDRIMLQKMHGGELLGVYSVAFNLCAVLSIIYSATNVAWVPFYLDFKKRLAEDCECTICLNTDSKDLQKLANDKYKDIELIDRDEELGGDTAVLDIDSEQDFELMEVIAKYLFGKVDGYRRVKDLTEKLVGKGNILR